MLKRLTWFGVGIGVGAGGTVAGYLRARELARRHLPESVQDAAVRVAGAAEEGAWAAADRAGVALDDLRRTATATRRDRREAEALLRAQLERAGL